MNRSAHAGVSTPTPFGSARCRAPAVQPGCYLGRVDQGLRELPLAVVGINHPNTDRAKTNRRSELLLTPIGAPMDLVLEPKNPHDPHAVAVFSPSGIQVGYLRAERAPWIGAKIRAGDEIQAINQGLAEHEAYIRVRIGGGAPTLPEPRDEEESRAPMPRREAADENHDGFWPDEDGPEWGA